METSFDLMVWRSALARTDPFPGTADLAEWATLLESVGELEAATLLADVAAIRRAFPPPPTGSAGGWTIHHALDELRALTARMAGSGSPSLVPPPPPPASSRPDNPAGIGDAPAPPAPDHVAEDARSLRAALEAPPEEGAAAAGAIAARWREAGCRLPFFDHRAFAQAPLGLLVPAVAAAGLIDWASGVRDLSCPPLGSPELLHAAARFDAAGLGPWFGNVGRLVRDAADLFDLARIAADAGGHGGEREAVGAWVALLSRGCAGTLLWEVVDELGDADAGDVLEHILDRAASRPPVIVDLAMIHRIRDAALDNADHALAARAQRIVVGLRPDEELESLILGRIQASGGDYPAAEEIFRHWLARSPNDERLRMLLRAARTEQFDAFRQDRGYGSPPDRQEFRLRRRGVAPDHRRRRGERIAAVDVR